MAVPNVPAVNQGEEPQQPSPVLAPQQPSPVLAPQRPGQGPVVVMPEAEDEEKHTVPPELPYARYHMANKLARGGWKRVSMYTIQSDDKRFTITHVDPTRRSDWFLLKDLETGESYETTTMTDAKKRAKELRGDAEDGDEYEDHEYCSECGECTTCNLRPCRDGGEHKTKNSTSSASVPAAVAKESSVFKSKFLRKR